MALYLLQRANPLNGTNKVFAQVVEANSEAEAKAMANAAVQGDGGWDAAVATTLGAGQSADFVGWKYRIRVGKCEAHPVGKPDVIDVTYTAVASDTVDLIGDALVVLLNATPQIAGAAYNSSTNVLTVAETTDGMGDATLLIEITPKGAAVPLGVALYSAVVHQGADDDALKVTLTAPSAIPTLVASL